MAIEPTEKVWLDGKLVPWDQANVHLSVHALHYGSSVFEGIRAYDVKGTPVIFCLPDHVKRLFSSCKVYRMNVGHTPEAIEQACVETVRTNGLTSAYIRPLVFRGSGTIGVDPRPCPVHVAVLTLYMGRYLEPEAIEQGVDICVSSGGVWRTTPFQPTPRSVASTSTRSSSKWRRWKTATRRESRWTPTASLARAAARTSSWSAMGLS